jgi:hypothetical protein
MVHMKLGVILKLSSMKISIFILSLVGLQCTTIFAQADRFEQEFQPLRSVCMEWDEVRGAWLAESIVAISNQTAIPDRTFPEDFTPAEMLRMAPQGTRTRIEAAAAQQQKIAAAPNRERWNRVTNFVSRPNCATVSGRSYGDPHLVSFDGATTSFQTVGEFVLVKSDMQNLEIQTRQEAQSDDFSLNTATAMNVAGDRVAIYANEKPDNISTSALRVNGEAIQLTRSVFFLPNGGTVRYAGNSYTVTWPTGETAHVQIRRSGRMNFLNIMVQIFPCAQNDIQGLLGNANGRRNDDFDMRNGLNRPTYLATAFGNEQMQAATIAAEKEYLAFLARDFAREFRVLQSRSLFDYSFGRNTYSYTDESYPRNHRSVGDLNAQQQAAARRNCEAQGITGDDLRACMFDNAFLQIPPTPRPVVNDPTVGTILKPVVRPVPNVNPVRPGSVRERNTPSGTVAPVPRPVGRGDNPETGIPNKEDDLRTEPANKPREIKREDRNVDVEEIPVPVKPKKVITRPDQNTVSPSAPSSPAPITRPAPTPPPAAPRPTPPPAPRPVQAAPITRPAPTPPPAPRPAPTPQKVGTPSKGRG